MAVWSAFASRSLLRIDRSMTSVPSTSRKITFTAHLSDVSVKSRIKPRVVRADGDVMPPLHASISEFSQGYLARLIIVPRDVVSPPDDSLPRRRLLAPVLCAGFITLIYLASDLNHCSSPFFQSEVCVRKPSA